MIEKLIGKTGLLLVSAVLMLCTAGMLFLSVRQIVALLDDARAQGRVERDLYWQSEIEKSNATAQAKIADNLKFTLAVQAQATDDVAAAVTRASELEKKNAALPDDPTGGLSRERVRLLNQR